LNDDDDDDDDYDDDDDDDDDDEFSPSLIFQPCPSANMEVWAAIPHPSRAMVNVWSLAGRSVFLEV